MATAGEKQALLFLSLVALVGSGVRLVAAHRIPVPTAAEQEALASQIRVVDSVRHDKQAKGRRQGKAGTATGKTKRRRASAPAGRTAPDTARPVVLNADVARPHAPTTVDVDVATAAQLESLPGIGPALARRIIAARDSGGSFGSLDALQDRVRGVGPGLTRRLAANVTFSGRHSPPSAERTEPFGHDAGPRRRRQRNVP